MTSWLDHSKGITDTHCHIQDYEAPKDLLSGLSRLPVEVWNMTISPAQYLANKEQFSRYSNIIHCPGFFPLELPKIETQLDDLFIAMEESLVIGEVGLDYTIEDDCLKQKQFDCLSKIFTKGVELGGRTFSIHSRRAAQETFALAAKFPANTMIFHWFSGSLDLLEKIPEHFYFSCNTAMVRSRNFRNFITKIPKGHILLETDGPYIELGSKHVSSCDLHMVLDALARYWELSRSEVEETIQGNIKQIKGKWNG
ncbi:MAG: TatD family hydrolase [Lentisphaeria bacterium]|nr:TatD family hydrolase [Lentisphaeria bacterium]